MLKVICSICGKELSDRETHDGINGAVVGEYIGVRGHSTCVHNVNRIVVIENRRRMDLFLQSLKESFSKAVEEQRTIDEFNELLDSLLQVMTLVDPENTPKA